MPGKILIVDDEKSNLDVLIHVLKNDYTVYPAKSGEAALKRAADIIPDLILLDIIMPDMNGFEVLVQLKNDELTEHIPVIFITGLSNAEDEKRGLVLGAADYITKPFNNEIVKARVKTQIQIVKQLRVIEEFGMIDEITLIPNRKSFDVQLNLEWARAIREKNPVSLIMIDIDEFDNFKNTYGRDESDELLMKAANVIKNTLKRTTDIMTRYGGTVFAIILSNTPKEGAVKVAEEIKKNADKITFDEKEEKITFSIGASTMTPTKDDTISCFVLQADRNLYKAKEKGNIAYY
ncbi:MAG: diguanylate cyclase [Oscillospiraceae bacterium]|nr:diguanylate cyclase [Oscillospiraceae bacterium]